MGTNLFYRRGELAPTVKGEGGLLMGRNLHKPQFNLQNKFTKFFFFFKYLLQCGVSESKTINPQLRLFLLQITKENFKSSPFDGVVRQDKREFLLSFLF